MANYGYIRVSKLTAKARRLGKDQSSDHNSAEAQEAQIRMQSAAAGLPLSPDFMLDGKMHSSLFVDEDVSSRLLMSMRPEGGKLYRLLKPGDHVFISKLDRAFRDAQDFLNTLDHWFPRTEKDPKKVITLHVPQYGSIDPTNPFAWAMAQMQAVFDELERRKIAESTSDALQAKAERGERTGGCQAGPGYRWHIRKDGVTVRIKDQADADMWSELLDWNVNGGYSYSQISSHLNSHKQYKEVQMLLRDANNNVVIPKQWYWKKVPWNWRMVKHGLQQAIKNGIKPKKGWPKGHPNDGK